MSAPAAPNRHSPGSSCSSLSTATSGWPSSGRASATGLGWFSCAGALSLAMVAARHPFGRRARVAGRGAGRRSAADGADGPRADRRQPAGELARRCCQRPATGRRGAQHLGEVGGAFETATALEATGWSQVMAGADLAALGSMEESLALIRDSGNERLINRALLGMSQCLVNLGRVD